jgi:hypothetical protein
MRAIRRATKQGTPHFIVVAAEEVSLSAKAFHDLTSPHLTQFASYELIRINSKYQPRVDKRQQEC